MSRRRWAVAGALWLVFVVTARAEDAPTFPPGGIADALKARVGKPVMLHLSSGTQISGTVGDVRDHAVVLKTLVGRELSDALVLLDHVSAVEVRARER